MKVFRQEKAGEGNKVDSVTYSGMITGDGVSLSWPKKGKRAQSKHPYRLFYF